ncbi:2-oxoisovalerate dehydrogenase E2 component (dihydrolipoyl transacylase) [Rhizomicrobium palustre]|uniref:Dihydrolipoamide acetyltransferase component of pyruvate dehydrogenase complex n=1 Tax=Rhizomicrobium palustre TaxID=189966 RepID=A0A846N1A4_9PROT|nr:dihydrolipoamide acetyltransferase family protein [Rhizomicrobium palustre]NIK89245.1 2-oxoisovalerate dehydrogenase E2 component (dihydrolipoyl transacylase) [Rhizomicrobium palustre]
MERFVFKLPDVGEGTAEAEIVAWHVAVGDLVHEDQLLVDVMTDKATVEMTSPVAGKVLAIKGNPGEMATVGAPLVEFELEGAAHIEAPAPKTQEAPQAVQEDEQEEAPACPARETNGKVLAAPAVRLRAADLHIDLSQIAGTGPGGRITHGDLDDFLAGGGARPKPQSTAKPARRDSIEEVKLIGLRRKIAEKMSESKRRIPHFAYVEEIDMTELESLRQHLNETRKPNQPKLTLLPFLMTAMVRVLPEFPQINAHFDDEAGVVKRYGAVHIGIATETEAGLMVPVVRHAETLDIWQAARAVSEIAAKARSGKASREELTGSTITVTSLGPLGGIASTPIINHPEVAILGPNAIIERPVIRDGQIAIRKMMNFSSCYDHRVVDGADAARFVKRLKALLEHPALLFMA